MLQIKNGGTWFFKKCAMHLFRLATMIKLNLIYKAFLTYQITSTSGIYCDPVALDLS